MAFPVVMYGCEIWTIRLSAKELMLLNWVLEKTPENPLDCKEIQPVNPKGDLSWVFIGRIDAEAKAPILQPPNALSSVTKSCSSLDYPRDCRTPGFSVLHQLPEITQTHVH